MFYLLETITPSFSIFTITLL